MTAIFQNIINTMALNPKKVFLLDGLGAVLSAFLLGVVLVHFETDFGMPHNVLYFLALIACVFAVYSLTCYFRLTKNWRIFIKIIAFANLLYAFISLGFVFYLYPQLSGLDITYFLLEILVLIIIIALELKTVAALAIPS